MKVAVAGSTTYSLACAQALEGFSISYLLTPSPKPVGRKHLITPNPLQQWGQDQGLPCIEISSKIDDSIRQQILRQDEIDLLLIVDFGFFIPQWLLDLPKIAPLNIHPSALPQYRGASPGQFALLRGDQEAAVSLMIPNSKMDQGDIISQYPFSISFNWNRFDYYDFAFNLINQHLSRDVRDFAAGKITPTSQPLAAPPPLARQLHKNDGFISFNLLQLVLSSAQIKQLLASSQEKLPTNQPPPAEGGASLSHDCDKNAYIFPPNSFPSQISLLEQQILQELSLDQSIDSREKLDKFINSPSKMDHSALLVISSVVDRATRAFFSWPEVWTLLPYQKPLRCKILEVTTTSPSPHHNSKTSHQSHLLHLKTIKIEGKNTQQL